MQASVLSEISSNRVFAGYQKVYSFLSDELKSVAKFAVYFPPQCETAKCPVLYFLSGLTCTEQNFITKAGAQQYAAKYGVAIIAPDTSPRDCGIEQESECWHFGVGAGFYVDATEPKWSKHYRMFSYVTKELPAVLQQNFADKLDLTRQSITGHSMGGHGALICALKNPGLYRSVSAFAPICNPSNSVWGVYAFTGYFGPENKDAWLAHDACELVSKYAGPELHLLVSQGTVDQFLEQGYLQPNNLVAKCKEHNVPLEIDFMENYDHSYYFISTCIGKHIEHHAKFLA